MHSDQLLQKLGFKHHAGGAHTSRTIMLNELSSVLESVPTGPNHQAYIEAIRDRNCLAKRSGRTRELTARHLTELYGLDSRNPIFAGLRYFWARDVDARPQLALLAATARDNLLHEVAPLILKVSIDSIVTRESVEKLIQTLWPARFSPATLKSCAQNVNSSLTKSGHLRGRARKIRSKLQPTVAATAFALYLGWLQGERGELLLQTRYCRLLDESTERLLQLASEASARGWMVLRRVDSVVDVAFPALEPIAQTIISTETSARDTGMGNVEMLS